VTVILNVKDELQRQCIEFATDAGAGSVNLLHAWAMYNIQQDPSGFLDGLLMLCSNFQASDPRDKIYAALGLLIDWQHPIECPDLLTPDYSLAPRDVYIRATIAVLHSTRRLDILSLAGRDDPTFRYEVPGERVGDSWRLPSWVPRYDLEAPQRVSAVNPTGRGLHDRLLPVFDVDKDMGTTLHVQGVVVGDVLSVDTPLFPSDITIKSAIERGTTLALHLEQACELDMGSDTHADLVKQIALTLGMFIKDEFAQEDESVMMANFGAFMLECKKNHKLRISNILERRLLEAGAPDEAPEAFILRLTRTTKGRHLVKMSSRHHAMAPLFTKPGDIVCILVGLNEPLIMRPKGIDSRGRTGEFWQLIGIAYIYGIMEVSPRQQRID
jgi:hypothetical protein